MIDYDDKMAVIRETMRKIRESFMPPRILYFYLPGESVPCRIWLKPFRTAKEKSLILNLWSRGCRMNVWSPKVQNAKI